MPNADTIRYDDAGFTAEAFLALAERIWPRDYDSTRAAAAALERSSTLRL